MVGRENHLKNSETSGDKSGKQNTLH